MRGDLTRRLGERVFALLFRRLGDLGVSGGKLGVNGGELGVNGRLGGGGLGLARHFNSEAVAAFLPGQSHSSES